MARLVWYHPDGRRSTLTGVARPDGREKQQIIDELGDWRAGWYDDDGVLYEAYGKEPFSLVKIILTDVPRYLSDVLL